MRYSVEFLSSEHCGGRETGTPGAVEASAFIARQMSVCGLQPFAGERFQSFRSNSRVGHNVLGCIPGSSGKWVLVCAYYDGLGTRDGVLYPGADSNASGVAALLEIARSLADVFGSGVSASGSGVSDGARAALSSGSDVSGGLQAASSAGLASDFKLQGDGYLFVALDGHNDNYAGAKELLKILPAGKIARVVNLDILGSTLAPVHEMIDNYLIALGAKELAPSFSAARQKYDLWLHYDYYGSYDFTKLFYEKLGDQSVYIAKRIPCIVFTSGITLNTNNPQDKPATLNYPILARRTALISDFLLSLVTP